MRQSRRAAAGMVGTAVCLGLLWQTSLNGATPAAQAQCAATVKVGAAVPVKTVVTPVETVIDQDTIYTHINDQVVPRIEPLPTVQAPVDTLKLQINNRMNSGIISGRLTNIEADEVQGMLDDVGRQEADFKLRSGVLTLGQTANLMRKYHMINQALQASLDNSNYNEYMPNFELRRAGVQRRIQYNLAAGNLTPEEAEQLLSAVSAISDRYAVARATGGTITANELEALHRDLSAVGAKMAEHVGGTIVFVAPATHDQLAQLKARIDAAILAKALTPEERACLIKQYNRLVILQDSIIADEGIHSPDIQLLAKEIDNLNFIITRQLRDRQFAGQNNKL